MPIYEYRCARCEHEFEVWQKMSEDPVKVCPKCHARKVERLISATSFQLKGSGWYATDYGAKKSGGAGKKKPSSGEGSSGGGATGSGSSGSGSTGGGASESGSKPTGGESSGGQGNAAAGGSGSHGRAAAAA